MQAELGLIDEGGGALWTLRMDREVPEVDAKGFHRREFQPARSTFVWFGLVLTGLVVFVGSLVFERHEAQFAFVDSEGFDSRRCCHSATSRRRSRLRCSWCDVWMLLVFAVLYERSFALERLRACRTQRHSRLLK